MFVCKLRKKLSTATGGDNYIETVSGHGYVLRDPQEPAQPAQRAKATALTVSVHRFLSGQ